METVETYLARKKEELELLNSFLSDPLAIRFPRSAAEVIEQKFHLAAALKAEHVLYDWAPSHNSAVRGSIRNKHTSGSFGPPGHHTSSSFARPPLSCRHRA
jgi:hypothetical protein